MEGTGYVRPESFDSALFSRLVLDLTNGERARHRLSPFASNEALSRAASAHSYDMARRGYFSHRTRRLLGSRSLADRLEAVGLGDVPASENIAMLPTVTNRTVRWEISGAIRRATETTDNPTTYRDLAHSVVQQWMASPGHRANILNPSLSHLGVGSAIGTKDGWTFVYVTQDFCAIR